MSATRISRRFALRKTVWRYMLLTHRWVGIGVGIVVLVWCLSGFVMMYVRYPALDPTEQLAALQPLSTLACCGRAHAMDSSNTISGSFALEGLRGNAVLRFPSGDFGPSVYDTRTGRWIDAWPNDVLRSIGAAYAANQGWDLPDSVISVERDQWTVHSRFNAHRPMLKFENSQGTNWYVSSTSAQIVQVTTQSERFWNWLGSVPHWLYPTVLRQHPALWAQVIIWLTIISLFLVITGIVIGVKQLRWKSKGNRSPYRAWTLWHHYVGLVFGLFTLTWVLSGLFSMSPWGFLDSRSFAEERNVLNGVDRPLAEIVAAVETVLPGLPEDTVRLESAYWLDDAYFLAWNPAGETTRIALDGTESSVSETDVRRALTKLSLESATVDLITDEDTYYYGLHEHVRLPAWRIVSETGDRIYIGEETGQIEYSIDSSGASNRWLFQGLHSLDFTALFRARPVWDILMLLLLAGVTVGVGTGTWLGIRRLIR